MPPKKRRGLDLPPGLYVTGKYYRWLDPRDGQYKGMGTDKEAAIADAKALNAIIYASLAKPRVETLSAGNTDSPTLSTVIRRHVELHQIRLERGRIKLNTMRARTTRSNALLRLLGDKPFSEIGVRDIAAKDTALWDKTKMPPTFREQRSLSARLYAEQGIDPQALLGHRDAMTTAIYMDSRGAEWVRLKVG